MTATNGTRRVPTASAAVAANTALAAAPMSSCVAPISSSGELPAVATVPAAAPAATDNNPATSAAPVSPTPRDNSPAATWLSTVTPSSVMATDTQGGPDHSNDTQARAANTPAAPSATLLPPPAGHTDGSARTVSATASATSS
jgi:hypothetical protein